MRVTTHDAIRMAAALTGVQADVIRGKCRRGICLHARAAVVLLMQKRGRSLAQIAAALERDPTTILNVLQHHSERQEVQDLADLIEAAIALNPPWHSRSAPSEEQAHA